MNFKLLYGVGTLFLFLGLMWLFLPHALHEAITGEEETAHTTHLIQGTIVVIISLVIMIFSNNKIKGKTNK